MDPQRPSSSSSLPSSHRSCLTLFFLVQFSLEQNGPPPAASCSGTQRFVPLLFLVVMETSGPRVASQTLHWDKRAFEQLCAGRSSFLGLQRPPAVKWQHGSVRYLTGRRLPCLIRFGCSLRASSVAADVTKHELWIWAWALVILEDECDKAQRAPCCCHLLLLFCLPDKSYPH